MTEEQSRKQDLTGTGDLPDGINPEDIIVTPYEDMEHDELIETCLAHDDHHNEHHEREIALLARIDRLTAALRKADAMRYAIALYFLDKTNNNAIKVYKSTDAYLAARAALEE